MRTLVLEFPLLRANPRKTRCHVDVTFCGQITAIQTQPGRNVHHLLVLRYPPRVIDVFVVYTRYHDHIPRFGVIVLDGGTATFRSQNTPLRQRHQLRSGYLRAEARVDTQVPGFIGVLLQCIQAEVLCL